MKEFGFYPVSQWACLRKKMSYSDFPFGSWPRMCWNRYVTPRYQFENAQEQREPSKWQKRGDGSGRSFQDCFSGCGRERGWGWLIQDLYLTAWLDGDVIVIDRDWGASEGSSEFTLVHVQPVPDPLNNTLLLVIYNNCKYYRNALSSHPLFLCHPKGLAGDFIYFYRRQSPNGSDPWPTT